MLLKTDLVLCTCKRVRNPESTIFWVLKYAIRNPGILESRIHLHRILNDFGLLHMGRNNAATLKSQSQFSQQSLFYQNIWPCFSNNGVRTHGSIFTDMVEKCGEVNYDVRYKVCDRCGSNHFVRPKKETWKCCAGEKPYDPKKSTILLRCK